MNKKKVINTTIIIVLIIFAIFICFKYFTKRSNYFIYAYDFKGEELIISATDIVYYGEDINYNQEYDNTNGIICMYTLYSEFDRYKDDYPIYIIGNVKKIEARDNLINFMEEINKYYFINNYLYNY